MSVVFEFLSSLFGQIVGAALGEAAGTALRADRHPMKNDRVRGAIRAASGRVHNIGTEWSVGFCELSAGHIRFVPSIGIAGNRELDVRELRALPGSPDRSFLMLNVPWNATAHFAISTDAGVLHWAIPALEAHDARQLLFPTLKTAPTHE